MKRASLLMTSLISLSLLAACGGKDKKSDEASPLLKNLAPAAGVDAAAKFTSPDGEEIGNAVLKDGPNGVLLRIDIKGLSEGWHGIHLHQIGDCSDGKEGFKASGGHINPDKNEHGLLNIQGFERADMANLYAGHDGRATAAFFNSYVRLLPGEEAASLVGADAILMDENGFAIIIHDKADDHESQPIGGAGKRLACAAFEGNR